MDINDIRRQFPQYEDLDDASLISGLHRRFYSDMPLAEFQARLSPPAPVEQPPSPAGGFRQALSSGVDAAQGAGYSALEGTGSMLGIRGLQDFGAEGRVRNQREAEEALPAAQRRSFNQAESLGDYWNAGVQALGTSLPSSATPMAGALAGAAIGSTIFPGPGSLVGGVLGGAAAAIPQFFGSNRQRQIEANPGQPVNEGAALGTAIPQALTEGVVDRLTLGLGRVFGQPAAEVGRTIIPRIARGIGVGAAAEIPAEVAQQAMERAQAGLDVLSDEAMQEYREAAIAAGVVGGTMGGSISGVLGQRPTPPDPNRGEDVELRESLPGFTENRDVYEQPVMSGPNYTGPVAGNPILQDGQIVIPQGQQSMPAANAPDVITAGSGTQAEVRGEIQPGQAAPAYAFEENLTPEQQQFFRDRAERMARGETPPTPDVAAGTNEVLRAARETSVIPELRTPVQQTLDAVNDARPRRLEESPYNPLVENFIGRHVQGPYANQPLSMSAMQQELSRQLSRPVTLSETKAAVENFYNADFAKKPQAGRGWVLKKKKEFIPGQLDEKGKPLTGKNRPTFDRYTAISQPGTKVDELGLPITPPAAQKPIQASPTGFADPALSQYSARGEAASDVDPNDSEAVKAELERRRLERGEKGNVAAAELKAKQEAYDKARKVIFDRLEKLRAKGAQGSQVRNGLIQALNDKTLTNDQLYGAFKAADIISDILPKGADHRVSFVKNLVASNGNSAKASGATEGAEAQGVRIAPNGAMSGIIQISLSDSAMPYLRETAAHEAFHVLQDYYGQYDPAFAKVMAQGFRDEMMISDVDPTIKRKLQSAKIPGTNKTYWDSLVDSLPGPVSAKEAQAYVFGSLMDAQKRGVNMTGLKPAMVRFMGFLRQFFQRMGNALKGDGFRNANDLLGEVAQGDAKRFDGKVSPVTAGEEQLSSRFTPPKDTTEDEAQARSYAQWALDRAAYMDGRGKQDEAKSLRAIHKESVDRADKMKSERENYTPPILPVPVKAINAVKDFYKRGGSYTAPLESLFSDVSISDQQYEAMASDMYGEGERPFQRAINGTDPERKQAAYRKTAGDWIRSNILYPMVNRDVQNLAEQMAKASGKGTFLLYLTDARNQIENMHQAIPAGSKTGSSLGNALSNLNDLNSSFDGLASQLNKETLEAQKEIGVIDLSLARRMRENGEYSARQITTPEFQKWFEGSKVVTPDGIPLVVYHGTSKDTDFKAFKLSPRGTWFTENPESASDYAEQNDSQATKPNPTKENPWGYKKVNTASRVIPAYLSIKNPATLTERQDKFLVNSPSYARAQAQVFRELEAQGYDGVKMPGDVWVAFRPAQAKSAIGNRGTFDPKENRIDYSARSPLAARASHQAIVDKITGPRGAPSKGLVNAGLRKFFGAQPTTYLYDGTAQEQSKTDAFITNSINRDHAGHMLDAFVKSKGRWTGKSAGRALENAHNNNGRVAQLMERGGIGFNAATGTPFARPEVKSLLAIFKGRVAPQDKAEAQAYLAALRERDLRKVGRQGFMNLSNPEIASLIQNSESTHPEWKDVATDLQTFNKMLLDFAVNSGILEKSKAHEFSQLFYTPFYRQMEGDPSTIILPSSSDAIKNIKSSLNTKLEGGEAPLGDLFQNIIRNADAITKAGMKNNAMKVSSKLLSDVGLGQRLPVKLAGAENIITFKENGKEVHFRVDDPLMFTALSGMPPQTRNELMKVMATVAGFFRDMITAAPNFIMANIWRGKLMAYVQEGVPLMSSTLGGFKRSLQGGTSLQNFTSQTGFGGYTYGMGDRDMAKAFERELSYDGLFGELSKGNLWAPVRTAFRKLNEVSEASEMAERVKLYEQLVAKGVSEDEASFQAYLLAPFSRRGAGVGPLGGWVQSLVPMVPFLNAKIQGLYRTIGENEKGDSRSAWTLGLKKQLFLRGLVLTAFSTALYAMNLEDHEDEWNDLPVDTKMRYDVMFLPAAIGGGALYIPKVFEVGSLFGSMPVIALDAIRRNDGRDIAQAVASLGTSTFFFNPIPAAVVPTLQAVTNRDFFRNQPLENRRDQSLPVEERVNQRTTLAAQGVAGLVNNTLGQLPGSMQVQLSPIKAQSMLEGHLGSVGQIIMSTFDSLIAASGGPEKPAGPFGAPSSPQAMTASILGLGRFYRDNETSVSRFVADAYELKAMTDQLANSARDAMASRDAERVAELRANPTLRMRPIINDAAEQMGNLSQRMRLIQQRGGDAQDIADALVPLRQRRDQIARQVVDRVRAATP